jgi:hypothetical protein
VIARFVILSIFCGVKNGYVLANDLILMITVNIGCAGVPAHYAAVGVNHKDGVIFYVCYKQAKKFFVDALV